MEKFHANYRKVKLVAMDVDDTIAPHPRHGERNLELAYAGKEIIGRYPEVYWSALTGQPKAAVQSVVKAAGITGTCVWEMGYLMGHIDEEPYPTMHPEFLAEFYPEVRAVEKLRKKLLNDGVAQHARKHGIDADIIREKQAMLSFRTGNSERNYGKEFVEKVLPEILDAETKAHIGHGKVEVLNPGYAVDIKPKIIGKAHALMRIMKEAGAQDRNTLVIVDSGHSDMEMIQYLCRKGYAACPANASPDIKREVQAFGGRGYISPLECKDGAFEDILRKAAEKGWF